MSFDLAGMNVPESTTPAEAGALYIELCEGNVNVVAPSENIDFVLSGTSQQIPRHQQLLPISRPHRATGEKSFDLVQARTVLALNHPNIVTIYDIG